MSSSTVEADIGTAPAEAPTRTRRRLRPQVYTGIYIWAAFVVVFGLWVPETFLTTLTARTLVTEQAVTAIVAIGLLLPLAAGIFDLSVGSMLGLAAVIVASFTAKAGMPLVPAIALTLLIGAGIGAVNAFLVVVVGLDSFIATLGVSSVLLAPTQAISGDTLVSVPPSLVDLTAGTVFGIPVIAVYMLAIAVVVWYVLEHTPFGRRMAAIGPGREAARLAGVRTARLTAISLVCSAVLASVAGILLASKLSTATPELGLPYLLPPFAAAFLGATQIKPGRFNVWGTLVAIFLLATGVKGLQLVGAAGWVTDLFNGMALIIAVSLSLWGSRLAAMRRRRPAWRRGGSEKGTIPT